MSPEWTHSNIMGCLAILTRMEPRGRQLIVNLKNHADVQYRSLPETQTQLKYGAAGFIAFLILLKLFA
ncbi:hypothetical protein WS62_19725 [Burkholderia sp. ABCPW 14]|nr:hypothetical protein WS62_19725 [Burkholderia sp. ABCPW 14]